MLYFPILSFLPKKHYLRYQIMLAKSFSVRVVDSYLVALRKLEFSDRVPHKVSNFLSPPRESGINFLSLVPLDHGYSAP
jgi:hypothetical protein